MKNELWCQKLLLPEISDLMVGKEGIPKWFGLAIVITMLIIVRKGTYPSQFIIITESNPCYKYDCSPSSYYCHCMINSNSFEGWSLLHFQVYCSNGLCQFKARIIGSPSPHSTFRLAQANQLDICISQCHPMWNCEIWDRKGPGIDSRSPANMLYSWTRIDNCIIG